MSTFDLAVTFPAPGRIVVRSRMLFGDVDGPTCRRFVERVFQADEILQVTIKGGGAPRAELRYCAKTATVQHVVGRVVDQLRQGPANPPEPIARRSQRNGQAEPAERGSPIPRCLPQPRATRDRKGVVRYFRDAAPAADDGAAVPAKSDFHLGVCTVALPVAATAQLAFPPLFPVAAAVCVYAAWPTFRQATDVLIKQRRLGVDMLDTIVVLGCLGTMSPLPSAVLCWCRSVGHRLAEATRGRSKTLLLNTFGKPPQAAWITRDGVEVQVPLERLRQGDIVTVNAGEVVPVDGHVVHGLAMVDQQALTGEPGPAEKGVGDRVFAASTMLAGTLYVSVEACGDGTASAAIGRVLNEAAGHRSIVQERAERLADRAVVPALALGGLGLATMGPAAGMAVLKSNVGTGIRSAAPYAVLGAVARCAYRGIIVKQGRGLERMNEVDTIVLDASAIVDPESLAVDRIVALPGSDPERLLRLAAAAEQRFHHPIARAICRQALERNAALPAADDVQYRVGQGIAARVEGLEVRVGSPRFLRNEAPALPSSLREALRTAAAQGHEAVLVAVDDRLAGAIALRPGLRTELRDVVAGLRRRGVARIAIVAAEDELPHLGLATALGPEERFVERLSRARAGDARRFPRDVRTVCFVGIDGVPGVDADVRINVRGGAAVARNAADIVVFDGELTKLCELRDIARALDRNVKRSWSLIVAPNVACIAGVFTFGLGVMASVVIHNAAVLAALANSVLPLRQVARIEAERRHREELSRSDALERDPV